MEFSGQYLTHSEYMNLGGTLEPTPFNILEFEARKKIDARTENRLKELKCCEIPQEVKMCEFNMINSIENYTNSTGSISNNGNVASENTDGYSISYVTSAQMESVIKSKNAELNDIIRTYLLNVYINDEHILYCGVD